MPAQNEAIASKKRAASVSSDSSSTSRKRRHRFGKKHTKSKADSATNSSAVDDDNDQEEVDVLVNAPHAKSPHPSAFANRRNSLGKAARDPRDEPPKKKKVKKSALVANGSAAAAAAASGSSQTQKDVESVTKTRSPSPVISNDGLSRPSAGTRERLAIEADPERKAERLDKMTGAVRTLLECIGEDPNREGILDTPKRYALAMLFYTKGYQENVEDIVNGALFHEGHNEMVIVKDIEINTMCEHHLVPFNGKMHIGYIPSDTVIGLSKLPRIAEMFARRLQVQERLTKEVAQTIMEILKPQGVAVVMEAKHLCMATRGVQQSNATTITSCVLGCFERKSKTRNEFFSLVGLNRGT